MTHFCFRCQGNHWMKEIVTLLYADDVITMKETQHISERIPLLELSVDMNQCIQTYMGKGAWLAFRCLIAPYNAL